MKSKNRYLLLFLILFCSFVKNVFADELSFTISAVADRTEVVIGEEATITVGLKSSSIITSCSFALENDNTLDFVSKSGINNWNFDSDSSNVISNSSSENVAYEDGKNIFNLKYKINGDGKVTIKDIECKYTSNDGENETEIKGKIEDIVVNFTAKEAKDDTTLSGLKVTGGELIPEFVSSRFSYQIELDSPTFSLDIVANNSDYQDKIVVVDVNGNKLDPKNITFSNDGGQGYMYMKIIVNDDTSSPYELVAHYEQNTLDNSLSSLKINNEVVELKDGQTDYVIKVSQDVTEVNVQAILKDTTNFEFREGNEPGIFKIADGTTSIALVVIPKNSEIGATSKTYIIEIVKEGVPGNSSSSNNNSNNNNGNNNTTTNPSTGGVSMFLMAVILISSLIGSVILYQKNLEGYK